MYCRYPNLELLEYQAKIALLSNPESLKRLKSITPGKPENKIFEFDCDVFSQIWPDTNTAFDVDEDGKPLIGGSAMTKAYTVVFHETCSDTYCIFVNNEPYCIVMDATEKFLSDLAKRRVNYHRP